MDNSAVVGYLVAYLVYTIASTVAYILIYVLTSLGFAKIFGKAGETSWAGWVPIYRTWVLLKLGKFPGFIAVLPAIPIIVLALILMIMSMIGVAMPPEVAQTILLTVALAFVLFTILSALMQIFASVTVSAYLQKKAYWALLYAVAPYVWAMILGFDGSRWEDPKPRVVKYTKDDYDAILNGSKTGSVETAARYDEPEIDMRPGPAVASGLAAFLDFGDDEPPAPTQGKRK